MRVATEPKRWHALLALALAVWVSQRARAATLTDKSVVDSINQAIRTGWRDAGVAPAKRAPDGVWARRLYLDLFGRTPTVTELSSFLAQPRPSRRLWLVDRLLSDSNADQRARWLATEWANLLVGRTGGRVGGSLVERDSFEEYLKESFAANKPYDALMRELVTATGSVREVDDDFNPAANFLADKMEDEGVQATAKTAQLFMGVSVQCTQCHNHPFNEGRQNRFWELNAFFRQTRVERVRSEEGERPRARLVNRDFYGEGRGRMSSVALAPDQREAAESYYELRNGKLKVAYPVFLDGTSLADVFEERGEDHGDSGRVDLVDRRAELAELISGSPDFARSAVNREWSRFFGYGFTRPVHDMGPHNPPSHPELLEALAGAFRESGYDLNRLTRWIVMSDAYGLDSRGGRTSESDDPSLGARPLFARFYMRQLSAEQIYESLLTASRADQTLSEERREAAKRRWLRQFTTAFGNDENGEATSFNGSIPQTLAMMNSDLMRRATELRWRRSRDTRSASEAREPQASGFLTEVAADPTLSNAERVTKLYLAAVARRPDRSELDVCNQLLAAREGDAGEALRDIWWALLNSNEFILQH